MLVYRYTTERVAERGDFMRKQLIDFRKSLGLNTFQMSKRIGVSTSFYEKIEYGDRNPSYNFMTAFKREFPQSDTDSIFFNI